MSQQVPIRFDDRRILERLIAFMLAYGSSLDDLDVTLSKIAPVDLDLLHLCIRNARERRPEAEAILAIEPPLRLAA